MTGGEAMGERVYAVALKPCPFCGAAGEIEHSYHEDNDRYPRDFWHVRAVCSSCGVTPTGWERYGNQEQYVANFHVRQAAEVRAAAAWNTRIVDQAPAQPERRAVVAVDQLTIVAKRIVEWMRAVDDEADDLAYLNADGWADMRETAQMARTALDAAKASEVGEGWLPIESAPRFEPILAAIRVRHNSTGDSWWERHIIWCDDETNEIHRDCEQGWNFDDYEFWHSLPPIEREGEAI
jgi:Restriction alleviation protein Lar